MNNNNNDSNNKKKNYFMIYRKDLEIYRFILYFRKF